MTYAMPMFPPPLGAERLRPFDAVAAAARDGHPLADLIQLRREAADLIEWLLAFLDRTEAPEDFDGDDREYDPADDEPSLGAPERHPSPGLYPTTIELRGGLDQSREWAQGSDDGREHECEDEGAQCDDEGDKGDSGIADADGLLEQLAGTREACGGITTWAE